MPESYRGAGNPLAEYVSIPWWIRIAVVLGALLMAMGAGIALLRPAMLVAPGAEINEAARIYAGYVISRNFAIAILLIALLFAGAKRSLGHAMVLVAFIQVFDAAIDCGEGRWAVAPGVFVFGVVYLLAANRLLPHPFWKSAAWR
jgi:hypothetical protein